MSRVKSNRQTPAQPAGPPPIPQYPPYRAVLAPITPELRPAYERLSAAHWRACVALVLAEQRHAERVEAITDADSLAGQSEAV